MKLLKGLPINPAALKGIPAILRQPQWVAVIVSVGFHGALFAVGPSFSSMQGMALGAPGFGNQPERRVPMIELTPEEQSRLPDFDSPAYSLFPGELLPGEFPPSNPSSLMELFPPAGNLPSRSPLPPLPEGLSSIPRMPSPRPSLGAPVAVSPFPSRMGRNSIVIPNSAGNRPNLPMPPEGRPMPPGDRPEDSPAASTPGPNRPQDPRAGDLIPRDGDTVAANRESAPLNAGEETPTVSPAVARSQELMARVEYSDELTTTEESEAVATDWANALAEELGDPPATAEETFAVEVPYDLRICLNPEPSTGLLGFALLPGAEEGTVDISTTVLKSTGYPFLNQMAIRRLQTLAANSETPLAPGTIYQAVVTVLYDGETCVDTEALLKSRVEEAENATSAESTNSEAKPED